MSDEQPPKDLTGILDLPPIEEDSGPPEPASPAADADTPATSDVGSEPAPAPFHSDLLGEIKDFSERVAVGQPSVEASFPFHLFIEGQLTETEKEKLIELINRENLGIREMDLEPQIEAGKIKLPRISEYAAILIVQKLRATHARMRLIPADADPDEMISSVSAPGTAEQYSLYSTDPLHPAERIPITSQAELPNLPSFIVIDAVTASLTLNTTAVEATSSSEYEDALEALSRELKYKAHRKGAGAILNFSITLTPLSTPSLYRLTAIGSAVRAS